MFMANVAGKPGRDRSLLFIGVGYIHSLISSREVRANKKNAPLSGAL